MSELKTKPTKIEPSEYLATITDETRVADARQLMGLIEGITLEPAVMWGPSIIGFGSTHYRYASGHEGDTMKIGLSARKEHLVLYGVICYDLNTELLSQLGKHKQGKGCLYIKKLADVKLDVLEQMIKIAYEQKTSA